MDTRTEKNLGKVSIIIPAFNAGNTVGRCLESLLNQTYMEWEAIIVDDGSVDDTAKICQIYKSQDARIRYIKTENNGVSNARNTGLNEAAGEYIFFVDSDDYILPNCLECMLDAIADADVLLTGITIIRESGKKETVLPKKMRTDDPQKNWKILYELQDTTGLVGYISTKLYKRAAIESCHLRFNIDKRVQEDLDFALNVFAYNPKVRFLEASFYQYFYSHKNRKVSDVFDIIDNYLFFSEKIGFKDITAVPLQRSILWNIATNIHTQLYWCDNFQTIKEQVGKLLQDSRFTELYIQQMPTENLYTNVMLWQIRKGWIWCAFAMAHCRRAVARILHSVRSAGKT